MAKQSYDASRLVMLRQVSMPQLNRKRDISIYLPKGYELCDASFPVIYMHDGQNVIDPKLATYGVSWDVPRTLDRLEEREEVNGFIVVAIDNGAEFDGMCRYNEYSPWKMNPDFELPGWSENSPAHMGGEGKAYVDFIANTLKPYIDQNYRTLPDRKNTALVGSSMGGLISLYGVSEYQDTFGFAGVFSPAFWFNDQKCFDYMESVSVEQSLTVYMDMGTAETSDDQREDFSQIYLDGSRRMHQLIKRRFPSVDIHYFEDEGAVHNEAAWAKRFPHMVKLFEASRRA